MLYPWLETQWQTMMRACQQQALGHAWLFLGDTGMGQLDFARYVSQYLLCEASDKITEPCDVCRQCQLCLAGNHPDLHIIEPEAKASVIKIDQIRKMIDITQQTAQRNSWRIFIIDPADSLNTAASNALLKVLEEPGANTLIMLIAQQQTVVLPTLLSRCQRLEFHNQLPELSEQWLNQQCEAESTMAIALSLKLADYAPLKALERLQSGWFEQRANFINELKNLINNKTDPVSLAEQLKNQPLLDIKIWFVSLLEDLIRLHYIQSELIVKNSDIATELMTVAPKLKLNKLYDLLDLMTTASANQKQVSNENTELFLNSLLASI